MTQVTQKTKLLTKTQSTNFWKKLGVDVGKRQRIEKTYKISNEKSVLRRAKVELDSIVTATQHFQEYVDPLFFRQLSKFFRKDPQAVAEFFNVTTPDSAFKKLINIFRSSGWNNVSKRLERLFWIYELNAKGEGRHYSFKRKRTGRMSDIDGARFTRVLNREDPTNRYIVRHQFKVGTNVILAVTKGTGKRIIYKFIKFIPKQGRTVDVAIAADSKKEYEIIRRGIIKLFKVIVEVPESTASLKLLDKFLTEGESNNFILSGVNYFKDDFTIAVGPRHLPETNVAKEDGYAKYANTLNNVSKNSLSEEVKSITVYYKNFLSQTSKINFRFLNYENGGIIGAVLIDWNDRGFNDLQRKQITQDFEKDFGIRIKQFIVSNELSEKEIYRRLLRNNPSVNSRIELRSSQVRSVYLQLQKEKSLLPFPIEKKGDVRHCVNPICNYSHQRISGRSRKVCSCGEKLVASNEIIIRHIDEGTVAKYAMFKLRKIGFDVKLFDRKLLKRKIYVLALTFGNQSIEMVFVTKQLTHDQLQILSLRYPNLVVVTSKDDISTFDSYKIQAINLYEVIFAIHKNNKTFFTGIVAINNANQRTRLGQQLDKARERLINPKLYEDYNRKSKNFGAEWLEADVATALAYMFGNSVWLGAAKRGKKLPDGITAFPITGTSRGCFIWDSKLAISTSKPQLGDNEKNLKYIKDGRKNSTIRVNGGLKGFVFITNGNMPDNFSKRWKKDNRKLVGIKLSFIKTRVVVEMLDHYRANESLILRDNNIRKLFLDTVFKILCAMPTNYKPTEISFSDTKAQLALIATQYENVAIGTAVAET